MVHFGETSVLLILLADITCLLIQDQMIKLTKWLGTISYLIGMTLTAFNIYPINIVMSTIGALLWTHAAWVTKDKPLLMLEIVTIVVYGVGFTNFLMKG
jgi:hypothetical protein